MACILDLYSRMVVGWYMDQRQSSSLVIKAIRNALDKRGEKPGIIFHSDRGSQYASKEERDLLSANGIIQSMSRKGNCYLSAFGMMIMQ